MKIAIEEINGCIFTVIRHRNGIFYEIRETPFGMELYDGSEYPNHIATALYPLTRYPEKKDVPLMLRYAAEGIEPEGFAIGVEPKDNTSFVTILRDTIFDKWRYEITHCFKRETYEQVEVAIVD